MNNAKDKLLTSGDVAYAKNFNSAKVFADITSGNLASLRVQFEQYAYETVGDIQDFEIGHTLGDEKKITVDNCGLWDIDISMNKSHKMKFTWLDVNNIDVFAKILWFKTASVTGTAVEDYAQTIKGGEYALNTFIALGNQNGDGSAITPTSVTIGWTSISAWSSTYAVSVDSLGRSGITLSSSYSGAITGDLVITYDYDPYPQVIVGSKSGRASIPFGAYRFRSCVQTETEADGVTINNVRNTIYFIKFYITSEVAEKFINRTRKDFEGVNIEMVSAEWGYYIKVKETWTA